MGLRYIAWLLENQGKEVSVTDLYYAINPPDSSTVDSNLSTMTAGQLDEMGLAINDLGDAGDTLTPEGMKRLKQGLQRIKDKIEEANELDETEKAEELKEKRDQIIAYIAAESGLGGITRKASSNIERLRKAVSKRISTDIEKISKDFPDLGIHLKNAISTGTQCQYRPHPPVKWIFHDK